MVPGRGLFGFEAIVLVDDGPLNPLSSWPVRRALQHPDFGVVLGSETAENYDVDVLWIYRPFHPFQLLHHLIDPQKKLPGVFAEFHFHGIKIDG